MQQKKLRTFFNTLAPHRDTWIARNQYYYNELFKLHQLLIPKGKRVLDVGCGTGDLLHSVRPKFGIGIDISSKMVQIARKKYPQYSFYRMDAHQMKLNNTFDYIILSNLIGYIDDIWEVFHQLQKVTHKDTRIIITNYNYLWQPIMYLAEKYNLKMPDKIQNWLPSSFTRHFLHLSGFEVIRWENYLHIPIFFHGASMVNTILGHIPLIQRLGLIEYFVCRPTYMYEKKISAPTVTIIVPTHNEAGTVNRIIRSMPHFGKKTELVFVDLKGTDNTAQTIQQAIAKYQGNIHIKLVLQEKKSGKIGALQLGLKHSSGKLVVIYDADMTVPPDDVEKFYHALVSGKAEVANGTRLVYPSESGAFRFLNRLANTAFAWCFTWALGQHFTDTLCGTKAFWRKDFPELQKEQTGYHRFDKYGDFVILLGAYRKHLKIAEVPVRYKSRHYGASKLQRFQNGWQFLQMFLYFFWYYKIVKRK